MPENPHFETARRLKIATRDPAVVDMCDWVMAQGGGCVTHLVTQESKAVTHQERNEQTVTLRGQAMPADAAARAAKKSAQAKERMTRLRAKRKSK